MIGVKYRDHGVVMEGCVAECTKNVTEAAIAGLQGKHMPMVDSLLDDSFLAAMVTLNRIDLLSPCFLYLVLSCPIANHSHILSLRFCDAVRYPHGGSSPK